jgi:hypothetical protein
MRHSKCNRPEAHCPACTEKAPPQAGGGGGRQNGREGSLLHSKCLLPPPLIHLYQMHTEKVPPGASLQALQRTGPPPTVEQWHSLPGRQPPGMVGGMKGTVAPNAHSRPLQAREGPPPPGRPSSGQNRHCSITNILQVAM